MTSITAEIYALIPHQYAVMRKTSTADPSPSTRRRGQRLRSQKHSGAGFINEEKNEKSKQVKHENKMGSQMQYRDSQKD